MVNYVVTCVSPTALWWVGLLLIFCVLFLFSCVVAKGISVIRDFVHSHSCENCEKFTCLGDCETSVDWSKR